MTTKSDSDDARQPQWTPDVERAWLEEAARRIARMESDDDPGLTLEEFFSDDEP